MFKLKSIKWLLLAFLALIALSYFSYRHSITTPLSESDNEEISFLIKKGETAKSIGQNLEEKGLIKNPTSFYLHAKMSGLAEKILAGRFFLKKSMNIKEMLAIMTDAQKAQFLITIPEGLRIRDIDAKLAETGLSSEGDFIKAVKEFNGWEYYDFLKKDELKKLELPLEGYIYPDTYFLNPGDFEAKDLIYLALDNFELKTKDLLPKLQRHSVQEIVNMASIIEKEVFGAENQKMVSGILWKRLESDWPLGADATLLYEKDDRKISSEDLKSDSPYNTRNKQGLPLGPICNPSVESIEAAMYPQESDYWFYLTTKDGEVIYSKSNEEHNVNRAKYL